MMSDIKKALIAIAQGYPVETADDRYIIVENPDYVPDNGSQPNLVIDTAGLEELTHQEHSESKLFGKYLGEFNNQT